MTPEPQRLQYLDAMGLTAWVGRYQLPNALPTKACEWPEPAAPESVAPQARLHALIDEAPQATAPSGPPSASTPSSVPARPAGPSPAASARELLGMAPASVSAPVPAPADGQSVASSAEPGNTASWGTPPSNVLPEVAATETMDQPPVANQPSLRFSLQLAALEGRWLIVLPGDEAPHLEGEALLKALWRAAGITNAADLSFSHFRWPLLPNLKASAPLDEAREGLRAFLNGPARQGWRPERVLIFGDGETSTTLCEVLGITPGAEGCGDSHLLGVPAWQGPSLAVLARSSDAKRRLWPLLVRWGRETSPSLASGNAP